jgi:hypothetical protein
MQDTHEALRAQYEAEVAVNPKAWGNWQFFSHHARNWLKCDTPPGWWDSLAYRRNPDAPPFVPPVASKRHKHADLIIAAANGEPMQHKNPLGEWEDCNMLTAIYAALSGLERLPRIKQKTRTVQCRVWLATDSKKPCLWCSDHVYRQEHVQQNFSSFGGWLGETFSVEAPC